MYAFSSHKKCIICRRSDLSLLCVKRDSIVLAYSKRGIVIKKGSRCCKLHLDQNGLIKPDQFDLIPTKSKEFPNDMIYITEANLNVFDKFKNLYTLEENHCYNITRWSKSEFIRFSSYITSINESKGRSKYELIAIYRYWLRRGLDQTSLSMFKSECSQRRISHYLNQIRVAIYKDFVPFFLGAKSQDRNFFLGHNTVQTTELFKLELDVLCLVGDGSYTRLEKSANNQFQYDCWSEQKKDLLIKPFLLTCADGYIVDCYGPYKAHQNDAVIFEHILETDEGLRNLLIPNKCIFFLDRGFPDIFKNNLHEKYEFIPKMPTCRQLKAKGLEENEEEDKNRLTTKETSESRLVTKVRYIIEKQIGVLKNCKALDNIRNTIAGHVQIDYRIASAMSNFTHKPICPDGKYAKEIAQKIRTISEQKQTNKLEFILSKHLDTEQFPKKHLSEIEGFVKLSRKQMIREIFLGTFQIKQCLSYLSDLLDNSSAFYLVKKKVQPSHIRKVLIENHAEIIAVTIKSRHKRGKTKKEYKVFIEYDPLIKGPNSIKNYICNCKSGLKIIGCCVHVSTVIFYLSFSKHKNVKLPGEHLNEIFIKIDKEQCNQPRFVKRRRIQKEAINSSSGESDSSSGPPEKSPKTTESSPEPLQPFQEPPQPFQEPPQPFQEPPQPFQEPPQPFQEPLQRETNFFANFNRFKEHIPKWSAEIIYQDTNVYVSNTCTIDYYLFSFWVLSQMDSSFITNIPLLEYTEVLKKIIVCINELKWNEAKELYITRILKFNGNITKRSISLFGSEYNLIAYPFLVYQTHSLYQLCSENCTLNGSKISSLDNLSILFKKIKNKKLEKIKVYSQNTGNCSQCKKEIESDIRFKNNPNFIFIENDLSYKITAHELPKIVRIHNKNYRFLCATIFKKDISHFLGVFEINNKLFVVDDLGKSETETNCVLFNLENENFNLNISYSLFYLII